MQLAYTRIEDASRMCARAPMCQVYTSDVRVSYPPYKYTCLYVRIVWRGFHLLDAFKILARSHAMKSPNRLRLETYARTRPQTRLRREATAIKYPKLSIRMPQTVARRGQPVAQARQPLC